MHIFNFHSISINIRRVKSAEKISEVSGRLTGLMSRCRKPTEWMLSMASKICLPSLKVVEMEKVPRLMVRRKSARFLP